ncbi:hypothetical protein HMPREF9120_00743 [Neisseria sp. oral taxon 020 str. F0370]|nr:hypothetical protein HMPREF9120_00743 [Neisseria sp. oral taxon 020 str. F0370]
MLSAPYSSCFCSAIVFLTVVFAERGRLKNRVGNGWCRRRERDGLYLILLDYSAAAVTGRPPEKPCGTGRRPVRANAAFVRRGWAKAV